MEMFGHCFPNSEIPGSESKHNELFTVDSGFRVVYGLIFDLKFEANSNSNSSGINELILFAVILKRKNIKMRKGTGTSSEFD